MTIPTVANQSVQDAPSDSMLAGWYNVLFFNQQFGDLPPWSHPGRQYVLRQSFYNAQNTLVVGALTNLITRVKQTPWQLVGESEDLVAAGRDVLQQAQFGRGFDHMMSSALQDYLTLDLGCFIEVIGQGNPSSPLTTGATGLATLDALRCFPTGNPEFPVWYRSHRTNRLVKLHHTRVVHLVANPSPDPQYRGLGLSAMSRAFAVARAQMALIDYQISNLDDVPVSGILTISGVSESGLNRAVDRRQQEGTLDGVAGLRNLIQLTSSSPDAKITTDLLKFSEMPEGFDLTDAMETHVNLLALAINDDPQEIWPLVSRGLGTGAQSKVLHAKGQGKVYGELLEIFSRAFTHHVLPEGVQMVYRAKDTEQGLVAAQTAKAWTEFAESLRALGTLSDESITLILANTVPEVRDAIVDEAGNLRLEEDEPGREVETPTVVDDVDEDLEQGERVSCSCNDTDKICDCEVSRRSINMTRLLFEEDMKDFIRAINANTITRRRAGIVLRALIRRHGATAFRNGLVDGGIAVEDITEDDLRQINAELLSQSVFVTNMLDQAYDGKAIPEGRAELWRRKSMEPFYQRGLRSADGNGYYSWELGDTEEHCEDCLRFSRGHVHRLRDWAKSSWLPKVTRLECGGFRCDCDLQRATGPARGRFPRR